MNKVDLPTTNLSIWWRPESNPILTSIEARQNGRIVLQHSRTRVAELHHSDANAEDCPYGELSESGEKVLWIVAAEKRFQRLEWWDVPDERADFYDPQAIPGLFRIFANLPLQPEAILDFVREYGFLGLHTWGVWLLNDETAWGESSQEWFEHIQLMSAIIELFETLKGDKPLHRLRQLIRFDSDKTFFLEEIGDKFPRALYFDKVCGEAFFPSVGGEGEEGLYLRAGQELLVHLLSVFLQKTTRPWIKLQKAPQIRLLPTTLLGALYLQLTDEVLGKASPSIRCASCGKWFQPYNSKRKYCSDGCKQKDYRARKDKKNGE